MELTIPRPLGEDRSLAMLARVRAIVTALGICESRSCEEPGLVIGIEARGEISLRPNVHIASDASQPAIARDGSIFALYRCCRAFERDGYSSTLVVSPRTLELYVCTG